MSSLVFAFIAYSVLGLTVLTAGYLALKYRDWQQADIFLAVGMLAAVLMLVKSGTALATTERAVGLSAGLVLAQPYFWLRMVRHFHRVHPAIRNSVIACSVAGTLGLLVLPRPRPFAFTLSIVIYFLAVQGYSALAFTVEARHGAGVSGWRLRLAAVGAWSFAILYSLYMAMANSQVLRYRGIWLFGLLMLIMVVAYYCAFATPRRLRLAWQRAELYRFFEQVARREPATREEFIATDLASAASHGVSATATAVCLGPRALTVRAASDPAWTGLAIANTNGLLALSRTLNEPEVGTPANCELEIASRLAAYGNQVIVMPIAASRGVAGVLVVVQRQGSLFLEDDLDLLKKLCRQTGDTLEHARLIAEERDRQRREADARVQESESRLHLMLESIRDYAMVTLDNDGCVTSWNIGAEQVFGYSGPEILGAPATRLLAEGQAPLDPDLARAQEGERVLREDVCKRRDGTTFIGGTVIRPLRRSDRVSGGVVMVMRDVTEQRQLEERLRQGQKMEAIGRLAGGVAHDFNNLLTVILGYATMLESTSGPSDPRFNDVGEIRKAAERAAGLTRQLLAFSRQQVLQPRVIRLPEIVSDLMPMLRRVIGEHIEIADTTAPGVQPILADPGQLEQIIINLTVNARDAMPGGGRLTIRSSSAEITERDAADHGDAKPGLYTLLEVIDTGTGMDAATRARIFEPFFTTKEFGRGTGLGLSTVYGIVKQMGGGIEVDSEVGRGSAFRVLFPQAKAGDAETVAPEQPAAGTSGTETIMLVEDEAAVRGLVASVLERHGYRVVIAANPSAAREMARQAPVLDLLISDIVMPGGTGPDLVKSLQSSHPGLRTLLISGYAESTLEQQGLSLGTHFLQKPFTGAQLLEKVRLVLSVPKTNGRHAAPPGRAI